MLVDSVNARIDAVYGELSRRINELSDKMDASNKALGERIDRLYELLGKIYEA
ncbi:hypothetical protein [Vulcanisaeta sp. JCM 16161]|uniref:hypothetical protein n=1 Tax=Vulcanisaeta sp. JCM 16161 TaxID=1295372 RepID=UPI000B16A447|nr:hypothetical protein [Vulcanisaeta sp. JCM 16161]